MLDEALRFTIVALWLLILLEMLPRWWKVEDIPYDDMWAVMDPNSLHTLLLTLFLLSGLCRMTKFGTACCLLTVFA